MDDVKQVVEGLGYSSCVLVAHDYGGGVAWAFGRKFPHLVDKLIVMNSPPRAAMLKAFEQIKEQKDMAWFVFLFQLRGLAEVYFRSCDFNFIDRCFGIDKPGANDMLSSSVSASQAEVDAYKHVFSQPGGLTPAINWYRTRFLLVNRLVYDMDYTMPVLLVWGDMDVCLHRNIPDYVQEMNSGITVRRISDAGHFVQMDKPDVVNRLMREWLSEVESSTIK